MKRLIYLSIVLIFVACKGNENKKAEGASADTLQVKNASDTSAAYTCPMHPEVISNKPGQCPQCGMDLEIKS